jgi:hypothetical protein
MALYTYTRNNDPRSGTSAIEFDRTDGTRVRFELGKALDLTTDEVDRLSQYIQLSLGGTPSAPQILPAPVYTDPVTGKISPALIPAGVGGTEVQKDGVTQTSPVNLVTPQPFNLVALGMDYGLRPTDNLDTNFTLGNQDYAVFYPTVDGRVATLFGQSQVQFARNGVHNRFGSGHNITAQTQSPDHFEDGTTSKTFVPGQWAVWEYDSGHNIWKVVQQGLSKQAMDALYAAIGSTGGGFTTERKVQQGLAILETMSFNSASNGAGQPTSQTLRHMLATIPAGETLSHLTVVSGTVAGVGLVNQWMAVSDLLSDNSGTPRSVTNDRGAEAWAANLDKTFDLVTPLTANGGVDRDIIISLLVNAGTPPSFYGANIASKVVGLPAVGRVRSWNSNAGRTDPSTMPSGNGAIAAPALGSGSGPFYVVGT